jgi:hypothetical protein
MVGPLISASKISGIFLFDERHRCRSALGDPAANAAAFADGRNVIRQLRSGSTGCSMGRIVFRLAVSRQTLSRYIFIGSHLREACLFFVRYFAIP